MEVTNKDGIICELIKDARTKFEKLKKDADNPHFKSKFADLNEVLDEAVPILEEIGIDLSQNLDILEEATCELGEDEKYVFWALDIASFTAGKYFGPLMP